MRCGIHTDASDGISIDDNWTATTCISMQRRPRTRLAKESGIEQRASLCRAAGWTGQLPAAWPKIATLSKSTALRGVIAQTGSFPLVFRTVDSFLASGPGQPSEPMELIPSPRMKRANSNKSCSKDHAEADTKDPQVVVENKVPVKAEEEQKALVRRGIRAAYCVAERGGQHARNEDEESGDDGGDVWYASRLFGSTLLTFISIVACVAEKLTRKRRQHYTARTTSLVHGSTTEPHACLQPTLQLPLYANSTPLTTRLRLLRNRPALHGDITCVHACFSSKFTSPTMPQTFHDRDSAPRAAFAAAHLNEARRAIGTPFLREGSARQRLDFCRFSSRGLDSTLADVRSSSHKAVPTRVMGRACARYGGGGTQDGGPSPRVERIRKVVARNEGGGKERFVESVSVVLARSRQR
ncbi:hypothetical protein C8R44DRAFT_742394 [Mycena epipterygia]|nr:hypothetical protein C8R44DRAFT_742394 [Mycena epipterygia]